MVRVSVSPAAVTAVVATMSGKFMSRVLENEIMSFEFIGLVGVDVDAARKK